MISRSAKSEKPTPRRKKKLVAMTSGSTRRFSCECRPGLTNHHACQNRIGAAPTRPTISAIFSPSMNPPVGARKIRPVFWSPARSTRSSRMRCQKTNAMIVVTVQPMRDTISARRRSSRCSTTDMRASSFRGGEDLRRPLISRAIERR